MVQMEFTYLKPTYPSPKRKWTTKYCYRATENVGAEFLVKTLLKDAEGTIVAESQKLVEKFDSKTTVILSIEVDNPHLWHGREDPYLYTSCTRLLTNGHVLDEIEINIGLRDIQFDLKAGIYSQWRTLFHPRNR